LFDETGSGQLLDADSELLFLLTIRSPSRKRCWQLARCWHRQTKLRKRLLQKRRRMKFGDWGTWVFLSWI